MKRKELLNEISVKQDPWDIANLAIMGLLPEQLNDVRASIGLKGNVMRHTRVIPRDFFNESKLLKCLGRLSLLILNKEIIPLREEFDGGPFNIVQNEGDGSLSVTNYRVFLGNEEIHLFTPYNSKDNYPLIGIYKGEEYYMFNEDGYFLPNMGVLEGEE